MAARKQLDRLVKVTRQLDTMQNARIIVIGAGIAGISCATKLIESGFKNIRILEAENRLGGRVNTIPFGSNVLDMGAQW